MNLSTVFHLFLTELRRSIWFVAGFWLVLVLVPQMEWFDLSVALVAARIGLGDHWTRTTVQWRLRPVSTMEWALSRVLLGVILVALPVSIRQGWVFDSIGFSAGTTSLAALEGGMFTFLIFAVAFAVASLSENWSSFLQRSLLGFLLMTVFHFLLEQAFNHVKIGSLSWSWAWGWVYTVVASIIAIALSGRVRSSTGRLSLLTGLAFAITVTLLRGGTEDSKSHQDNLGNRVKIGHANDEPEGTGKQLLFRGISAFGLQKNEFLELRMTGSRGAENPPRGRDLQELNNYYGKLALMKTLPEQRVFLQKRKLESPPSGDDLPIWLRDPNDKIFVFGKVYRCAEMATLPLRDGSEWLNGEIHFQLEHTTGSGEDGANRFRLIVSKPALNLSRDRNRSFNDHWSPSAQRWKLVADHPRLGETVLLAVNSRAEHGTDTLLDSIATDRHEFSLIGDYRWNLIWPEGEATEQWMEGAVLKIYEEQLVGWVGENVLVNEP